MHSQFLALQAKYHLEIQRALAAKHVPEHGFRLMARQRLLRAELTMINFMERHHRFFNPELKSLWTIRYHYETMRQDAQAQFSQFSKGGSSWPAPMLT